MHSDWRNDKDTWTIFSRPSSVHWNIHKHCASSGLESLFSFFIYDAMNITNNSIVIYNKYSNTDWVIVYAWREHKETILSSYIENKKSQIK